MESGEWRAESEERRAESEEQGAGPVRLRGELFMLVMFLLLYTAGLACGLFGSWQFRWLKPEGAMIAGLIWGIPWEPSLFDAWRRGRSLLPGAVAFLGYFVPMIAILDYRFLDHFPPALRGSVHPLLPWDPRITLAVGIAVYVFLIARAIWLYAKRRRASVGSGV